MSKHRYLALVIAGLMNGAVAAETPTPISPPFTIRCYQGGVLIINEPLRAMPQKTNGLWRGDRWSVAPAESGLAIVVDPGQFSVCEITENPKRP
jgi:hypothetical protein